MQNRPHRQLNVQQQNAVSEESIRREAIHWRREGVPEALRSYGQVHGVQWERSIVIDLDIDFPGMPRVFGLLLTQDEKFIRFEIDTDEEHRVVTSVERWDDVSAVQNVNPHNRGIGAGHGSLAIKVLRELNASYLDDAGPASMKNTRVDQAGRDDAGDA